MLVTRSLSGGGIHIALLRGINVGGKHRLPMKELVALFRGAGCADVLSYIQSGNVVYRANAVLAAKLPAVIAAAIQERFGFQVPIVTRSAVELRRVVTMNPFRVAGADDSVLYVAFLGAIPSRARVAGLDANRSPGDSFALRGREIFLCCPNGAARTKLTNAYFDSKLDTTSTVRNWSTVVKLLELSEN